MAEDRIHLLSEALCNLVRAQEVVSNPASAVKELLDNAIDAGATTISLDIKRGGKEYIHITDNGCGMSPVDARMAFERHATSKLRTAEDLERIVTLGFRGEGLASIATVANVVLTTRRPEDELGTEVVMSGGKFSKQSAVVVPNAGTSIRMNELFFNVPGRRRSLKKDEAEERAVDTEFTQCVLAHHNISFSYYKGGILQEELPKASLKERICAVVKTRDFGSKLLPINYESPMINITGFIAHPDESLKAKYKQYFFANGRYIKHDYLRKAVELAYEGLIPSDEHPHFFIYITVPTENLDINIHPSKKEVRFVDEAFIFQLLRQLVRESISTNASIPTIDWDNPTSVDIPAYTGRDEQFVAESIDEKPSKPTEVFARRVFFGGGSSPNVASYPSCSLGPKPSARSTTSSYDIDWGNLTEDFERSDIAVQERIFDSSPTVSSLSVSAANGALPMAHGVFQGTDYPTTGLLIYKGKYIISSLRRSLALIDYHRAHIRVLYQRYQEALKEGMIETQELVFPESIAFSLDEEVYAKQIIEALGDYGFVFEPAEEGGAGYLIRQAPAIIATRSVELIHELVQQSLNAEEFDANALNEMLAIAFAELQAYQYGETIEPQKVDELLSQLFASQDPTHDPKGRIIISLIGEDDIERRFR